MDALDIIEFVVCASLAGLCTYFGIKRRAKEYCEYYNLDFEKFWKDESKIDFSNPDWDIPYLIEGKPRVFSKYDILEAEVERRLKRRGGIPMIHPFETENKNERLAST